MARDLFDILRDAIRAERPVVLVTCIEGPPLGDHMLVVEDEAPRGSVGGEDLSRVVLRDARAALTSGTTSNRRYGLHGEANEDDVTVYYEVHAAPPRLVIFGAVDFTAALARVGKVLGYRVVVCDARAAFATKARFPMADEVLAAWPDRYLDEVGATLGPRDAVCVLTHDPKFDVPAIRAALATEVGYLGAMGSRRTTAEREDRLRELGVTDAELERIMAPIGLDLGARTPEETAVAICAEIIALRTGREAASLKSTAGPLHERVDAPAPTSQGSS